MATFNVGGRTVNVPDDLDPSKPAPRDSLRNINPPPAASASYTNPSFRSGSSPQATAWQQEQSLRNAHLNPPAPEPQVRNLRDAVKLKGGAIAGKVLPGVGAFAGGVGAVNNARQGNYGAASHDAADAVASAALMTPAAPVAGVYLAGSTGVRAGQYINDKYIAPNRNLSDAIGGTINQGLRKIGLGVDDSAYLQQRAEERLRPPAKDSSTRESLHNPPFIPPDSSAAFDTDYSNGGPLRNMVGGNVTRVGNSYSGSNIGENFTINGQAPGSSGGVISGQSLRAADALAARQDDESYNRVAQQEPTSLRGYRVPSAVHSGNDWTARQRLRSLEMDAKGIHRTGRERRQAQAAYQNALRDDAAAMMSQPQLHAETNRVNASVANAETRAAADRYSSDNTLRGAFQQAMAEERKAQNAALYESLKYKSEQDAKLQERDAKNMDRTREQFAIYGDDNKVDQQATNAFMEYIHSVIPDYSTLPPRERAKYEPKVRALQEIYRNTRDQNSTDITEALLGHDRPRLNTMPNFKDGKLRQQHLEGLLPGGAGWGGYVVEQPDGSTRTVGKLDENALNSLRRNISTGGW